MLRLQGPNPKSNKLRRRVSTWVSKIMLLTNASKAVVRCVARWVIELLTAVTRRDIALVTTSAKTSLVRPM